MNTADAAERILDATIGIFNRKGLKFTMDDIAGELSMSKKTIYTVFRDKETMFLSMVDFCFDRIKQSEREVYEDESLSTKDKLKKLLGVLPAGYREIDFRQLYLLKDKYPAIYEKVENRLETGWELAISLMEQGIREEVFRPVNIALIKTMFEATLEQFFKRDVLLRADLTFPEALDEVVDIIMNGITRDSPRREESENTARQERTEKKA